MFDMQEYTQLFNLNLHTANPPSQAEADEQPACGGAAGIPLGQAGWGDASIPRPKAGPP